MEAETKLIIPNLMHSACRNNRAVLKKLTVADLFMKVASFSTTSIFIAAFTKSCHWIRKYYTLLQPHFNIILPITPTTTDLFLSLSLHSQNQATGSENITHCFKPILILFCQLHLQLQICFFPYRCINKIKPLDQKILHIASNPF